RDRRSWRGQELAWRGRCLRRHNQCLPNRAGAPCSHACDEEESITVYQRAVSALARASAFRTVVPRDSEGRDHRQRAADPYRQRDHRNIREECESKASERETYVQDGKSHQPPERIESTAMRVRFGAGAEGIGCLGHRNHLLYSASAAVSTNRYTAMTTSQRAIDWSREDR